MPRRGSRTTAARKISRQLIEKKPYVVWNEFVDIIGMSNDADLSKKQRPAHLVYWYYSEVENGGHLQYFENRGTRRIKETVSALEVLEAPCHARVLSRAVAQFKSRRRSKLRSVEEYVETALEGEFDRFDRNYARCRPPLEKALEAYLTKNQSEFVMLGETTDPEVLERDAKMERIGREITKNMKKRSGRSRQR